MLTCFFVGVVAGVVDPILFVYFLLFLFFFLLVFVSFHPFRFVTRLYPYCFLILIGFSRLYSPFVVILSGVFLCLWLFPWLFLRLASCLFKFTFVFNLRFANYKLCFSFLCFSCWSSCCSCWLIYPDLSCAKFI